MKFENEKNRVDHQMVEDMDELKKKILDIITEYEKKYNIEIHIGEFKYDHLNDKKDIILIVFDRSVVMKMRRNDNDI